MIGNRLVENACDYADECERLRKEFQERSPEYLQGRIEEYEASGRGVLFGRFFEPQRIRVIRSVLENEGYKGRIILVS